MVEEKKVVEEVVGVGWVVVWVVERVVMEAEAEETVEMLNCMINGNHLILERMVFLDMDIVLDNSPLFPHTKSAPSCSLSKLWVGPCL